jgi:glycosidase
VEMKANCVWLSHMNNLSAGFDQINSSYGNIDEFKQLLSEYHRHNLKVLIDYIPNYTNDDHVWFRAMNETFRDFYVWTDTPNNWVCLIFLE